MIAGISYSRAGLPLTSAKFRLASAQSGTDDDSAQHVGAVYDQRYLQALDTPYYRADIPLQDEQVLSKAVADISQSLSNKTGLLAYDLGAGEGRYTAKLLNILESMQAQQSQIVATDVSGVGLMKLHNSLNMQNQLGNRVITRLEPINTTLRNIAQQRLTQPHLLLLNNVVHNMSPTQVKQVLRDAYQALLPGGHLIISGFLRHKLLRNGLASQEYSSLYKVTSNRGRAQQSYYPTISELEQDIQSTADWQIVNQDFHNGNSKQGDQNGDHLNGCFLLDLKKPQG